MIVKTTPEKDVDAQALVQSSTSGFIMVTSHFVCL